MLVIFSEVVLHFSTEEYMVSNDYAMPATIVVFSIIAWLLKTDLKSFLIVVVLMLLYGVVSFLTEFSVYISDYPENFADFASVIMIKTLFYTLPLLLMVALKPRKR